jgi:membrane-bound ClpP family serine protease
MIFFSLLAFGILMTLFFNTHSNKIYLTPTYWRAVIFMLLGIIFFFTELSLPGFGIFGMLSFLFILISLLTVFFYVPYGMLIVILQILLLAAIFFILFHILNKNKKFSQIILKENLSKDKELDLNIYLNKIGKTITTLKPVGLAKFDNDTLEVHSISGLIKVNTKIKVIEIKNKKIFVDKCD